MGWVTLTQRKMELKQTHAQLTYRNLQIAREKRQMAREKTFETLKIQTAQKKAERQVKADFYARKEELDRQKAYLNEYLAQAKAIQKGDMEIKTVALNGNPNATVATSKRKPNTGGYILSTSNTIVQYGIDNRGRKVDSGAARYISVNPDDIPSNNGTIRCAVVNGEIKFLAENDKIYRAKDNSGSYLDDTYPPKIQSQAPSNFTDNNGGTIQWEDCTGRTMFGVQTITIGEEPTYAEEINAAFDTTKATKPSSVPATLTDFVGKTKEEMEAYEDAIKDELEEIQNEIDEANLEYQEEMNETKSEYEFELSMYEQEAQDEELILDQEQTQVETQLESVSAELQSISDAASQQIQSSTIRLA